MWLDLLVCHCDQSRGFWESQQVKEESQLQRDGEGEPLVTGGVQVRVLRLRGVVRKPRECERDSLSSPELSVPGFGDPLCLCFGPTCLYFRTRARLRNL